MRFVLEDGPNPLTVVMGDDSLEPADIFTRVHMHGHSAHDWTGFKTVGPDELKDLMRGRQAGGRNTTGLPTPTTSEEAHTGDTTDEDDRVSTSEDDERTMEEFFGVAKQAPPPDINLRAAFSDRGVAKLRAMFK